MNKNTQNIVNIISDLNEVIDSTRPEILVAGISNTRIIYFIDIPYKTATALAAIITFALSSVAEIQNIFIQNHTLREIARVEIDNKKENEIKNAIIEKCCKDCVDHMVNEFDIKEIRHKELIDKICREITVSIEDGFEFRFRDVDFERVDFPETTNPAEIDLHNQRTLLNEKNQEIFRLFSSLPGNVQFKQIEDMSEDSAQ